MKLYVRDNKSICPKCKGLITARQNYYFCVDCGLVFVGIEDGRIDGEVIIEQVFNTKASE